MRVLLIEDDENKRRLVSDLILEVLPGTVVIEARSMRSGLRAILDRRSDLIILDMTMPTFDITAVEDGGRPQAYAGRELLRHMKRHGIKTPTIVVTQFDRFGEGNDLLTLSQLNAQLLAAHPDSYLGAVYYDVGMDTWKTELRNHLKAADNSSPGTTDDASHASS